MKIPGQYVTKERYGGRWVNTFFDNAHDAKKLCMKIISQGGRAVWMRSAS